MIALKSSQECAKRRAGDLWIELCDQFFQHLTKLHVVPSIGRFRVDNGGSWRSLSTIYMNDCNELDELHVSPPPSLVADQFGMRLIRSSKRLALLQRDGRLE